MLRQLTLAMMLAVPAFAGDETLDAAVAALGGIEKLATLDNWIVEGSGRENLSAELQGVSPDRATWRPHQEAVAVLRGSGSVAWQRRTPRNDLSLRERRFMYTPDARGVVDWVGGVGRMMPATVPATTREALMRRIPHVLVLDAATGRARDIVLTFSSSPALLRTAEYTLHMPGRGVTTIRWTWSGWKPDATLGFVPGGHRIEVGGVTYQEVHYSRYEAGAADAATMLRVPQNLRQPAMKDTIPAAGPASGEVAPAVHVVPIQGFQAMFIEMKDHVIVFDALAQGPGLESIPATAPPAVDAVANALLENIRKTAPGKPVRYVVISHHHSDHVGGLKPYVRSGATFLVSRDVAPIVRRAGGRAEIVTRRRVITDGTRTVEVRAVGKNPHTDQNLFVWLPRERILLNGDLFYFEEGAPFPPSGRETMNRFFAQWLAKAKLEPKAIYGVHYGGAAGRQALALTE